MSPLPQIHLRAIERISVRDVWPSEAEHFTPWRAGTQNLDLLGEALGIDLALEKREKNIGPYRADLVLKQVNTDNWVLIENQLELAKHVHRGQILTCAARLDSVTVAGIAQRRRDDHRGALDRLNGRARARRKSAERCPSTGTSTSTTCPARSTRTSPLGNCRRARPPYRLWRSRRESD